MPWRSIARCANTTHAQPGLERDPGVMRALARCARHDLGVYATVVLPGSAAVGDPVELFQPGYRPSTLVPAMAGRMFRKDTPSGPDRKGPYMVSFST